MRQFLGRLDGALKLLPTLIGDFVCGHNVMTKHASRVRAIYWENHGLMLLDQRQLPNQIEYVRCDSVEHVVAAIETMVVRGAPAIGIAAAYGVVLAVSSAFEQYGRKWPGRIADDIDALKNSRPTAVNLKWALDAMTECFPGPDIDPRPLLLDLAHRLYREDIAANRAIGDHGALYLEPGAQVLTHCNAGALATAGYGTALGVIRSAWDSGNLQRVYATETRPWLQGARLTAWELQQDGIPVTLIADNAAAHLMREGNISCVITGADRIAANGDVANKIGTYTLALCAREHGVRFMVAAPLSTIDQTALNGDAIPIEQRPGEELLGYQGFQIAPSGIPAYNPVFDVTPAALIDTLVTEVGTLDKPDVCSIAGLFKT